MQKFFENNNYPFGMMMPGRKYSAQTGYRYGFNGKENDNEVKGEGNEQDYGMRVYDPRVGRFLSIDPLQMKYPELTPYQFASNSPIQGVDLDGREIFHYTMVMNNQGKAILSYAEAPKEYFEHSFLWWSWKDKIGSKKYIVDYDGKTYHIGFPQYGTGYANAWKGDEFENNYLKKLGDATDFENEYADDQHSQAASDVAIVVNAQNVAAEHSIPMAGEAEIPTNTANKATTAANGGNPEAAEANTANKPQSKFLGGSKGSLYSKQNILEGNHAPTMNSYDIAGFKISYNKGSAFQMIADEHQSFISSGNSKSAQAFRTAEAALLKQGKFTEAFELTTQAIQKKYGNKYNEAIQQARSYYQTNIVPELQKQLAAKALNATGSH